jgi:putative ABC transport system substrate-binding protein
MDRRGFHAALLAASLSCAVSRGARAEAAPKKRLGILAISSAASFLDGGRQKVLDALAALGYVAGRNLVLEERYEPATPEAIVAFARELAAAHVDAILTEGTPATLAAQRATRTIPIVTTGATSSWPDSPTTCGGPAAT